MIEDDARTHVRTQRTPTAVECAHRTDEHVADKDWLALVASTYLPKVLLLFFEIRPAGHSLEALFTAGAGLQGVIGILQSLAGMSKVCDRLNILYRPLYGPLYGLWSKVFSP